MIDAQQHSTGPDAYFAPDPFTDPRDLSSRLERLATRGGQDPAALAEVVRSVMVHVF